MRRRQGFSLVEVTIGAAIGLSALGLAMGMLGMFRKPAEKRDLLRATKLDLAIGLERVIRAVRDADAVIEAVGDKLLLRTSDGGRDLYLCQPPSAGGDLIWTAGVGSPSAAKPRVLASGLSRCSFQLGGVPAGGAPPGELIPSGSGGAFLSVSLAKMVGGELVRASSGAVTRNGGVWLSYQ